MSNDKIIQKIEELSLNAFPGLQTLLLDGWLLSFSEGYSKRANSVNPLYASHEKLRGKIEKVEQIYQARNLPVIYKLTSQVFPKNLDNVLEQANYSLEGLTSIQLLSFDDLAVTLSRSSNISIYNCFEDKWFSSFCELKSMKDTEQLILKEILKRIVPEVCYVVLFDDKQEVLACGMGVLEGNYIGLFDIVTNPQYRNKGYGTQLISAILDWGKENGAKNAYLQVVLDNIPALNLYTKLGFKEVYKYWYRIKR